VLTILVHDFRHSAVVNLLTAAEWASNAVLRLRQCFCGRIFGGGGSACEPMFVLTFGVVLPSFGRMK